MWDTLCIDVGHLKCLFLLFQAVFNVTRGRYPLPVEEFHSQAGIQAAVKYLEEGKTFTCRKGEEDTFYPPHMRGGRGGGGGGGNVVTKLFKKTSPESKSLLDELNRAHQEAVKKCEDPHQLKILYLQLCWHKPYYSSVFFKGVVEKPPQFLKLLSTSEKRVVVAVNTECVHLMAARSPSVSMCVCVFQHGS
jgi:hypothetical protein